MPPIERWKAPIQGHRAAFPVWKGKKFLEILSYPTHVDAQRHVFVTSWSKIKKKVGILKCQIGAQEATFFILDLEFIRLRVWLRTEPNRHSSVNSIGGAVILFKRNMKILYSQTPNRGRRNHLHYLGSQAHPFKNLTGSSRIGTYACKRIFFVWNKLLLKGIQMAYKPWLCRLKVWFKAVMIHLCVEFLRGSTMN